MDWTHILTGLGVAGAAIVVAWLSNARRLLVRVDELTTQVFSTQDKVFALQRSEAECREREADIRADLNRAQRAITDMRERVGMPISLDPVPGIIITDNSGVIVEFSPSLTVLLGWAPEEMKGKHLDTLLPPALMGLHKDELQAVIHSGATADPSKKIPTYALDKNGVAVAVMLSLRRWDGGQALLTAMLSPRGQAADRRVTRATDDALPIGTRLDALAARRKEEEKK